MNRLKRDTRQTLEFKPLTPSEGQELAMSFAHKARYSILAMKPGQGKTLCAVEHALRNKLFTLVICPGYARNEWVNTFTRQNPDIVIENFKKRADIYEVYDVDVVILSYEMLYNPKHSPPDKMTSYLASWADQIIFDECQMLKGMTAKRTHFAHKIVYERQPKYLMLLTGTPIKNRLDELYSLLALCHYKYDEEPMFLKRFPKWHRFAEYFSYEKTRKIHTKRGVVNDVFYEGTRNLEHLKKFLNWCYFTMPERLEFKLKDRLVKYAEPDRLPSIPELEDAFNVFVDNNKSTMPEVKVKAAEMTAPFTAKLCRQLFETYGPIVVFTDHQKSCEKIADSLKVRPIHGGVSLKERVKILEAFQNGEVDYIVATYGTLSTAVSLVRSYCMVLNDPPWVPGDLDQTMARIDRKGQERQCIYFQVLATKQSKKIYETLKKKRATINALERMVK